MRPRGMLMEIPLMVEGRGRIIRLGRKGIDRTERRLSKTQKKKLLRIGDIQ